MDFTREQLQNLPSPYYRVATRAIILDESGKLLVLVNKDGEYELPGGGWEYGESFAECLAREVREEVGAEIDQVNEQVVCLYRGRTSHGKMSLRIAVRVTLKNHELQPVEMVSTKWVSKNDFLQLDFTGSGEEELKKFADKIWSKT